MKQFDDICAVHGDDVEIAFTVKDRNDQDVDLTDATATFRLAEKGSRDSLLELTEIDGITLSGATATCAFNTEDIQSISFEVNQIYNFTGQLRITINGKSMVASQGQINIGPLIE